MLLYIKTVCVVCFFYFLSDYINFGVDEYLCAITHIKIQTDFRN